MISGVRIFVVIIVLLAVGTVVVPFVMKQNETAFAPKLTVLVDGKPASKQITIKVDDTVYQCKKGMCPVPGYHVTNGSTFTIAELTAERALVWVIDATEVLKEFDRRNLTIAVDSAQGTVMRVESIQTDTDTTAEEPFTLENLGVNLNVDPNTVKIFGVLMVLVIILIGMKFMSVGGAHH